MSLRRRACRRYSVPAAPLIGSVIGWASTMRKDLLRLGFRALVHQVKRFGLALEERACQLFGLFVGGMRGYRRHLGVTTDVQDGGSVDGEQAWRRTDR